MRMKTNKIWLFIFAAALVVGFTTDAAYSEGWFTSKIEVTTLNQTPTAVERSAKMAAGNFSEGRFVMGSVGDNASILCSNTTINSYNSDEYGLENFLLHITDEGDYEAVTTVNQYNYNTAKEYQMTYDFVYENNSDDLLDAYVRFRPANRLDSLILDNVREVCLQSVAYLDESGQPAPMARLDFTDQDSYYYYPLSIRPGDGITLVYSIFLLDGNWDDAEATALSLEYEMIQTINNASAFRWNVIYENDIVYPFNETTYIEHNYTYTYKEFLNSLENDTKNINEEVTEKNNRVDGEENIPINTEPGTISPDGQVMEGENLAEAEVLPEAADVELAVDNNAQNHTEATREESSVSSGEDRADGE